MMAADGNTAWLRLDGGRGRRIVQGGDGIGLTVMDEEIRAARIHTAGTQSPGTGTTTEGH
ncbi:hypothetical protein ACFRAU_14005 [Arthrobacter sp. NPDC056691]|uniref:hypothetical protein n=1 Tax=Arthrobacter sp. NPDC056691 TaxID=3345913 RepID=UPI003671F318